MIESGNESTAEFDDFMASGDVEVGSEVAAAKEDQPAKRRGPPKMKEAPAADDQGDDDQGDDQGDDDQNDDQDSDDQGGDDQDGEGDDDQQRQRRKPSDRIRELTRRNRELQRQLESRGNEELLARLENIERGLQGGNGGDNRSSQETPAPDPTDTDKYPLGHLDDRYIEDKLEWLAEKKATERADAVLQRQQEYEQGQQAQRQQEELLVKVDDLATKGIELFDDFQESVVEASMRGDWVLSQATFEAAHEAEHGAQILYDLSQNKAEAKRVANLSPYQQLKFVQARDAEIAKAKAGRRVPQAGDPPRNPARGANSRTSISPATDNLDDFEKAWANDAKKGYR